MEVEKKFYYLGEGAFLFIFWLLFFSLVTEREHVEEYVFLLRSYLLNKLSLFNIYLKGIFFGMKLFNKYVELI